MLVMARFEGPRGKNRNNRGRDFEDRPKGRSRDFEDRPRRSSSRNRRDFEKTRVTCDSCGASCEVPFKPTSNKPVYCDACFNKGNKGGSNNQHIDLSEINKKLDKIMKALEIN